MIDLAHPTRRLVPCALAALLVACGGGDADDGAEGEPGETAEGTAAAQPTGSAPRSLEIDADPAELAVPIPPSFDLEVTQPGEYQIDVVSPEEDPEIFLYLDEQRLENDNDGGEGLNARVVRFLAAGTYSIRVVEHRARPMTARVSARRLEPLTPVGRLNLGQPLQVQFPEIPLLQRPRNIRDAARAATLEITEEGEYTCTASASNGRDAIMALIRDGRVLGEDDDGGTGDDAQITQRLTPGTYVVRVWDWIKRGDMIITVTCNAA